MEIEKQNRPLIIIIIAILTTLTVSRVMALSFLPTLELFDGISPNAWLGPWVTDSLLGLLLPVVLYQILKGRGLKTWALLIIYSAIGAFDYITGFITQLLDPLPIELAAPSTVIGSIVLALLFQLTVVILLFRKDVIQHFTRVR